MSQFRGCASPVGNNNDWDDWDPTVPGRDIPVMSGPCATSICSETRSSIYPIRLCLSRPLKSGGPSAPAGLAASARAETSDYLTVTYDLRDLGFVELYEALMVPQWSAPFGRLLLSVFLTLPRDIGWQVLDVACGTGYPTLELARFLGQDCDLAGIDVWEDAIATGST